MFPKPASTPPATSFARSMPKPPSAAPLQPTRCGPSASGAPRGWTERRDVAETRVDLARRKLRAVYAEAALRHVLAAYEMAPIRQQVDAQLEALREVNAQVAQQLLVVGQSSRAWWKSYRVVLGQKKSPNMFFMNF